MFDLVLLRCRISIEVMTAVGQDRSLRWCQQAARPLFPHEETFVGTHRTSVSC